MNNNKIINNAIEGCKIAIYTTGKIAPKIKDQETLKILENEIKINNEYINKLREIINENSDIELNKMISIMIDNKINLRERLDDSESGYIKILIEGCDLGINKLNDYKSQLDNFCEAGKILFENIIKNEEIYKSKLLKSI